MASIRRLKRRLRRGNITQKRAERIANRIRAQGGKVKLSNFGFQGGNAQPQTREQAVQPRARKKFPQINKSANKANTILDKGTQIGQQILPEVFEGGQGLDRIQVNPIQTQQFDIAQAQQELRPSLENFQNLQNETNQAFGEVIDQRRQALGGFSSPEVSALRDQLFADINRQRQGALRQVAETPNLGAGASFAQRRALNRDFGNLAAGANQQIALQDIALRRQAASDLENSQARRLAGLAGLEAGATGVRGQLANINQQGQQFNITNDANTQRFNANLGLTADQFNALQQLRELGARTGAISTGVGLIGDERANIQARRLQQKMLDFLNQRDDRVFNQALGLL